MRRPANCRTPPCAPSNSSATCSGRCSTPSTRKPALPRHDRRRSTKPSGARARRAALDDPVTGGPVLLYPEGVLPLDETTHEMSRRCSGDGHCQVYRGVARRGIRSRSQPRWNRTCASAWTCCAKGCWSLSPMNYRPVPASGGIDLRCPLHCPYCSNPLQYRGGEELATAEWRRVFKEAAQLGVLHVGFSGGEPLRRADLAELVAAAREAGLYTNLITSAVGLQRERAPRNCARPDWTASKSAFSPMRNRWRIRIAGTSAALAQTSSRKDSSRTGISIDRQRRVASRQH